MRWSWRQNPSFAAVNAMRWAMLNQRDIQLIRLALTAIPPMPLQLLMLLKNLLHRRNRYVGYLEDKLR